MGDSTTTDIRNRARAASSDRDTIPLYLLVGNIPTEASMEALRELRLAGEMEMVEPGYWRLNE